MAHGSAAGEWMARIQRLLVSTMLAVIVVSLAAWLLQPRVAVSKSIAEYFNVEIYTFFDSDKRSAGWRHTDAGNSVERRASSSPVQDRASRTEAPSQPRPNRDFRLHAVPDEILAAAEPGHEFQDCVLGETWCPVMVVVPAGDFLMGKAEDEDASNGAFDDTPQRRVSIGRLAVSKHETTFDNWAECVADGWCNPPSNLGATAWADGNIPVINVNWIDAGDYAEWLSQKTGNAYRLLSEAEWEYAARAGSSGTYSWGDDPPTCEPRAKNGAATAECDINMPLPVGSFAANAFGLHDMHGNAYEWVEDCYGPYTDAPTDGSAVSIEWGCERRVTRGGSWNIGVVRLPLTNRRSVSPAFRNTSSGFRVARSIEQPRTGPYPREVTEPVP